VREGDDPDPRQAAIDATAEGSRARTLGLPRDACPHEPDSEEADEWLEGYDGRTSQGGTLAREVKD
jgi:hypothetical protein